MLKVNKIDHDHEQGDLDLMRRACKQAGVLALGYFEGRNNKRWRKADGTAVSEADLAVDQLLHEMLLEDRPDYGWLSEETVDDQKRLNKRHVWIVDPIDGTRAFLQGKPHWVVSVALVVDGVVQMGCLYNPVSDEFFEAQRGKGAWLNGERVHVGDRKELEGATMVAAPGRFAAKNWPQPWPEMNSFMVNSIAYRMALVSANKADGVLALSGKSDWDLAAADLLVREAGGCCSDHKGTPFIFNQEKTRHQSVLVANPVLHEQMLTRTKQVEARKRHGCGHND